MHTIGFIGWTFGFILITGNCYQLTQTKSFIEFDKFSIFSGFLVVWAALSIFGGLAIAQDLQILQNSDSEVFACTGLVSLFISSIGFSLWKFLALKQNTTLSNTKLAPYQLYLNLLGVISSVLGILSFFLIKG